MNLAPYIELSGLEATVTEARILELCREAEEKSFRAVCVPPCYVETAAQNLKDCETRVCTVSGFPMGYLPVEIKSAETHAALKAGADEINMSLNISAFKSGDYLTVGKEILQLAGICHAEGKILKVIIESGLMNQHELRILCELCITGNTDFILTASEHFPADTDTQKITFIKSLITDSIHICAAGNIETSEHARHLIQAGVTRIQTHSAL